MNVDNMPLMQDQLPLPPINYSLSLINPSELESHEPIFGFGQFLYIKDLSSRTMIKSAWDAVEQLEMWSYMRKDSYSYMLSGDTELIKILAKIEELGYRGHSGCSFCWTMRQIQDIAQNGEAEFRQSWISLRS
jgi:hypothetical protein